jgi:hypothetical protein
MSMPAVFLAIEKAFDTTWHSGLLYKLSELEFSTSPIKLIASFLTKRKFEVLVEGEFSAPRVPQDSVLAPILYSLHQCCPTFLYVGAHLTDGRGGAGALWRFQQQQQ